MARPRTSSDGADGTLGPGLLVGDVIGLEDAGRALAAMSGINDVAGMTVVKLPPAVRS